MPPRGHRGRSGIEGMDSTSHSENLRDVIITAKILASITCAGLAAFLSFRFFNVLSVSLIYAVICGALTAGGFFASDDDRKSCVIVNICITILTLIAAALIRVERSTYDSFFALLQGLFCLAIFVLIVVLRCTLLRFPMMPIPRPLKSLKIVFRVHKQTKELTDIKRPLTVPRLLFFQ